MIFQILTYINRAASRCCTSLLRWRTLRIYCRSSLVIPSKADFDCLLVLLLMFVSAVESVESPVDASILRWILEACVGVGGSRALRPLPIFLFVWKQFSINSHFVIVKWSRLNERMIDKTKLKVSCCVLKFISFTEFLEFEF